MSIFAGVGLASMRVKEDTTDDYLVAGRGMHPALAALSAVSTWNSGYMFIGFVGFTYMHGYSIIWLALVSTLGQVLAWMWCIVFALMVSSWTVFGISAIAHLVFICGIVLTVATFETAKRRPQTFDFVKGYNTPSRSRGSVWINGKKTVLPNGDPGGEHE